VEDDSFVMDIYRRKLQEENYDVVECSDGSLAWDKLQEKSENPNLILLDIIMPKMNGLDLLKKLQSDEELKKIPVIMLTNMSQKEDVNTGLNLGAKDYLIKSHFTPSEVMNKIKSILN
jgi:DNA-binding response OmpR family regulator